jgi:hypothetical protein
LMTIDGITFSVKWLDLSLFLLNRRIRFGNCCSARHCSSTIGNVFFEYSQQAIVMLADMNSCLLEF